MKMNQTIQMIKKGLFYNVKAHSHLVEWQKHGLTHCLLIVWFDLPIGFEFTPHFIDSMISTELPPLGTSLREIIEKCNIHGPCGIHNPKSLYMFNGKCEKDYQKLFKVGTELGEDAYPVYRRRSPEHCGLSFLKQFHGRQVLVTNQNVIPYNACLSNL
jgi:hypothetical protein